MTMADVIEMVPSVALDEKLQSEVRACAARIKTEKVALRRAAMAIGHDGAFIESLADRGSWQVLGYKHQHDFRMSEGIGRSNWYRVLGIAKHFLKIDREMYCTMSVDNAERLSLEPEAVRLNPENIRRAAEMKAKDFDELMTSEGAEREGIPERERWRDLRFRLRDAQYKAIEEGLKSWMDEHDIANEGYGLELLIAEYRDRPTLTGFLLDSMSKLTAVIKDSSDLGELKILLANYVLEVGHLIESCCGAAEEVA